MEKIEAYNVGVLDLLKVENVEMSQAKPGRCAARGVIFVEKNQSGWLFSYRQNRDAEVAPVFNVGDVTIQEIVALMAGVAVKLRAMEKNYPKPDKTVEDYKWSCNSSFGPISVSVLKNLINGYWSESDYPDAWQKIIYADVTKVDMASLTLEERSQLKTKAEKAMAERLADRSESVVKIVFSKDEIHALDPAVPFCWNFWALTQPEYVGCFHRHTYNNYDIKDGLVFIFENRSADKVVRTTSRGWYGKSYPIRYDS